MLMMIFACDLNGVIGKNGDLPWKQSTDLQFFKKTTLGKTVVMGRKTWDSLPFPLPGRRNIVISRSKRDDVEVMSIEEVRELAKTNDLFIIGGGEIYSTFIKESTIIYRTIIDSQIEDGDTFAPEINPEEFSLESEQVVKAGENDDFDMKFQKWIRN
jgi:dihydrofolate reductase